MPRKSLNIKWIFWLILALSTVARVLLSVFPKTATTYYDELFYLELAQNIHLRNTLTVYGAPLNFTKLLYPLLLSPFYAVKDPVLRIQLISAFNALLTSSALIPAYLLSRRLLRKSWQIAAALLFVALSPNLLYSLSFMSENLWYPLLLWGVYALYRYVASDTRSPLRAFLLGLLAFVLYFAKEAGAAYIGAALVALLADGTGRKKSRRSWLCSLGCYLLGVLVPYVLLRLTLLRGMGNLYAAQLSNAVLTDWPRFCFFLTAAGLMLLEFSLTALWFPVAVPVACWKRLSAPRRSLLLFSLVFVLLTAFGTAYGVSLPEEFASGAFTDHQRYFIGILLPFLLLYLSVSQEGPKLSLRSPLLWATLVFAGLTAAFLFFPSFGSYLTSPVLHFTRPLRSSARGGTWLLLFRLGLPALFLAGLALWNRSSGKQLLAFLLLPVFFAFECASDVCFVRDLVKASKVRDPQVLQEARILDSALDDGAGTTLLLAESPYDPALRLFNTLLDDEYLFVPSSHFRALASEGVSGVNLKETTLPAPFRRLTGRDYEGLAGLDRIILLGDSSLLDPDRAENITPEGISSLRVFRPMDPSVIPLRNPGEYLPGDTISFYGSGLSFRGFSPSGFSDTESAFTWSLGQEASLTLRPKMDQPKDLEAEWTWQMTVGDQPCRVYANDVPVLEDVLSSDVTETYFTVPAEAWADSGVLTLRFVFPEARQPNAQDTRLLAVAFRSLTLTEP